jgi:hypothetical protein
MPEEKNKSEELLEEVEELNKKKRGQEEEELEEEDEINEEKEEDEKDKDEEEGDDLEKARLRLNELAKKMSTPESVQDEEEDNKEESNEPVEFFKDSDESPTTKELNEAFNKLIKMTKPALPQKKLIKEVKNYIDSTVLMSEFFVNNPELMPYRDYVSKRAKDLAGENPKWGWPDLFDNLRKEVTKELHLSPKKNEEGGKRKGLPKKGHATRGRSKSEQKSSLQKQLDELGPNRLR